jgi:hypothetical protein
MNEYIKELEVRTGSHGDERIPNELMHNLQSTKLDDRDDGAGREEEQKSEDGSVATALGRCGCGGGVVSAAHG